MAIKRRLDILVVDPRFPQECPINIDGVLAIAHNVAGVERIFAND